MIAGSGNDRIVVGGDTISVRDVIISEIDSSPTRLSSVATRANIAEYVKVETATFLVVYSSGGY